jgi:predicted transposase/invertase (TIGR01784 family)
VSKLKYTFKTDTLFKLLFGVKYPQLLRKLVAVLLGIQPESIGQFEVRNPEMPPEVLGEKFCRLDINMEVDGQRLDLEIQVDDEGDYPERALYYWAREYSSALKSGDDYLFLPKTIVISIVAFEMFDCEEFHSEFRPLEVKRHTPLTDRMNLRFFELPKLPKTVGKENRLELWLSLFRANTEEELAEIEALGVPELEQVITAYRQVTVTPEFMEMERLREKARSNEASVLRHARQVRNVEIARNALSKNMSVADVADITGLTREEVERLRNS